MRHTSQQRKGGFWVLVLAIEFACACSLIFQRQHCIHHPLLSLPIMTLTARGDAGEL